MDVLLTAWSAPVTMLQEIRGQFTGQRWPSELLHLACEFKLSLENVAWKRGPNPRAYSGRDSWLDGERGLSILSTRSVQW